ncbi:glycosyltransferase family 4 protein [Pontibacter sp. JH31]|uniref:Glycosyltransferase family 4 protein n=1 Tax=Pontibacter aquaedesilientis TaxID=2766980 RepID=A0ABR7XH29_9BACT|nr:glycosyltransferase family 4 protein [Pontibacter aquaedesilientis]MBD1397608.1 glycosyltransferase family 4 protein [Pontibacter aquaedesilientis]
MKKKNLSKPHNKLLFIVQLPPPVHGASMMNKFVVESSLINNEYDLKVLPLKFVDRIDQIGSFSWKKAWLSIMFVYNLVLTLTKFKPNLVYYTIAPFGNAFLRDAFFVFIIKLFRSKILFHLHGKGIKNSIQKKPWMKTLYRQTFQKTSVIHLSQSLLYDLDPFISTLSNIFVVPNGIPEINDWEACTKVKHQDKVQIIYLSNLDTTKGVLVLFEALKILNSEHINFEANIIGNSSDITINNLKNLVKASKLNDKVKVVGPKYSYEKYQYLFNADIFVFPTYYENECFPLSILEAMQMGNAIISTNNGAIKEIVVEGENGFIVEQKNPVALSIKIKELINNRKLLNNMKSNNKKKYKDLYTLQNFEKSILECIERASI